MRAHRLTSAATALAVVLMAGSAARAQVTSSGEVTGAIQKKIVDRMIVSDSVEIEMARLAASQTKNPAVRDLAVLLIAGHRSHLDTLRKLAESPDVGRATDAGIASDLRAFVQLRSMPADSSFDRAFVAAEVQLHQQAIDNLRKWRPVATSPALQQEIDRVIPLLEAHLARAQAVAAKQ
jgi:predicted outer membrane protein